MKQSFIIHLVLLLFPCCALAQPAISFKSDIAPILFQKCQACHNEKKTKGEFRLDSFAHLMKGGGSGQPSVAPADPSKSELYRLITTDDAAERMPQKDEPLNKEQVALIEKWIRQGARFDGPDPAAPLASLVPIAPYPKPPAVYPKPVPILALAFCADGNQLAVGGYHEITIWNAQKPELVAHIADLPRQTHALALDTTGKLLFSAGGTPGIVGELSLIDLPQRKKLRSLARPRDAIFALAISPDAKTLAAGGADNLTRIYDLPDAREKYTLEHHADWLLALSFSPDSQRLLSGSRDKSARIFDLEKKEVATAYLSHDDAVLAVAFSSDGKTAFSAGRDPHVHVWNTSDASKTSNIGAEADVLRIIATEDHLFIASTDRRIRQYTIGDRKLFRTFEHDDWPGSIAIHKDSRRLAAGGFNGKVRIWNLDDGQLLHEFLAVPTK